VLPVAARRWVLTDNTFWHTQWDHFINYINYFIDYIDYFIVYFDYIDYFIVYFDYIDYN
jgi:hypothetical protein